MDDTFKINAIDQVVIRVKDLQLSANWYADVLGLKEYKLKKWGHYPIFMLSNKCGVVLFPTEPFEVKLPPNSTQIVTSVLSANGPSDSIPSTYAVKLLLSLAY